MLESRSYAEFAASEDDHALFAKSINAAAPNVVAKERIFIPQPFMDLMSTTVIKSQLEDSTRMHETRRSRKSEN